MSRKKEDKPSILFIDKDGNEKVVYVNLFNFIKFYDILEKYDYTNYDYIEFRNITFDSYYNYSCIHKFDSVSLVFDHCYFKGNSIKFTSNVQMINPKFDSDDFKIISYGDDLDIDFGSYDNSNLDLTIDFRSDNFYRNLSIQGKIKKIRICRDISDLFIHNFKGVIDSWFLHNEIDNLQIINSQINDGYLHVYFANNVVLKNSSFEGSLFKIRDINRLVWDNFKVEVNKPLIFNGDKYFEYDKSGKIKIDDSTFMLSKINARRNMISILKGLSNQISDEIRMRGKLELYKSSDLINNYQTRIDEIEKKCEEAIKKFDEEIKYQGKVIEYIRNLDEKRSEALVKKLKKERIGNLK